MSNLRDLPGQIGHQDLMLASPTKRRFSERGWIYELKYDGFRCLTSKRGNVVRLESRNGRDISPYFPELVDDLRPIPHEFTIDGELVIQDEQGRPQWDRVKRRSALRNEVRIRRAAGEDPAAILAFDLLWLNGADFRPRPLLERKAALYGILPGNRRVRYAGHFADSCEELWALAVDLDLEGIVAKDARSTYTPGRSTRWQKIKTAAGAERERQRRP